MKISSAWKKLVIFLLGPVFLAIPGTILGDQWWEILNPEVVIKIEPMAVLGTLQSVKARGKLVVGVKPDSPPLSFVDRKGANQGLEIDIAKNLAKKLFGTDKAVEFVSVTSESRIPLLIWGMVDVVAATLTVTEEGKREVDFSTPYFVTGQMILVRADSKITKYQDLAGKKVATIRGSTGDVAIEELVHDAERIQFEGNLEALQALKERRVEAFVEDFVLLYALLQKNPKLKMASLQPFCPGRYGLAVRKGDKEWLDFINGTLTKVKETGEYDKLLGRWFGNEARVLRRLFEPEK